MSKAQIEDFERFYRDNNNRITPIKHPDLSTQPSILSHKLSSNYIFEQILFMGSDIKGTEFILKLPFNPDISNPMIISSSVFSNSGFQCSPITNIFGESIQVDILTKPGFELPKGDYYLLIQYTESLRPYDMLKENNVDLGRIGDDIYWKLNKITKTLSLNGFGKLSECSPAPWNKDKDIILNINISENITYISNLVFKDHLNLRTVSLGNIEEIGSLSFSGCKKLNHINFPKTLKKIGNDAFANTGLCLIDFTQFTEELPEIGHNAFSKNVTIKVRSKEILDNIKSELKNKYTFII